MTTDAQPVIRLTSPGEWLQAVPYLFGFSPRESLVVLGLVGPRKRVTFQLRVDLPRRDDDVAPLARHVVECLGRQGVDHVLVLLYGDDPGPPTDLDRALWAELVDPIEASGDVVDALVVRDGRWWSLVCTNPRCCPIEGTPWSPDDSARVSAELVLRGCVARGSRDEVAAEIAPVGGPAQVLVAQRCAAMHDADWTSETEPLVWSHQWVDAAVERWRSVLTSPGRDLPMLDPDTLAALLYPLDHKTLRDRVAGVCLNHADRAKPLLREVLRRAPDEYAAPPATILGLLEWADGDGLRAGIAFERALRADPAYAFAGMLYQGLQHGLRFPEELREDMVDMARKRWRKPSAKRRG